MGPRARDAALENARYRCGRCSLAPSVDLGLARAALTRTMRLDRSDVFCGVSLPVRKRTATQAPFEPLPLALTDAS